MERTISRLRQQLSGGISQRGDSEYNAATATWAKSIGPQPQVIVHCRTSKDVQAVIRAARDADFPLSVRGGGHDWAGRALCGGLVIDLRSMNGVIANSKLRTAQISGGACASEVLAVSDLLGLAAVTGACGGVGMAGLTVGGGYGPLTGRFGLALDNLLAAEVVLADGRIVTARHDNEPDLFWALRGGGGNFGVITSMQHRLHDLANVRSGMLIFPFAEAESVLEGYAEITASAPDELTVQLAIAVGPDGVPVVIVAPTWSGTAAEGEAQIGSLLTIGNVLANTVDVMSLATCLKLFDPFIVGGQRVLIETCWLPALGSDSIDILIQAMANAVSPGCAILTHEFKGAASRIAPDATAFRLRHDHVLVEILAAFPDPSDPLEEQRHQQWAHATLSRLIPMALPGGYPNLLSRTDQERAAKSFGRNADRLMKAKRQYDPDNVFNSAIPLPSLPPA
ncbi:FAD-binding oxidoreductase [Bradyrhizobium sp. SYSU BS000235]|uniref:FAD-binding oxidoreductase n=1 Tax=Bradyrhizobium sp. SYSU BS000235 TaxID=3411332 RepID=UPI003C741538